MTKVRQITSLIQDLAPENLAYDWDNVGLQVGDFDQEVSQVLISLDITEAVIEEAKARKCQLIISHHPLIFKSVSSINKHTGTGRVIIEAIKNNISIYSAHTNLDITKDGLNDYLAEVLGIKDCDHLEITGEERFYKLVVFIPEEHFTRVKKAILDSGAGYIGNYSHTSFSTEGKGTFKPLAGSNPFLGKEGEISEVREVRLETILAKHLVKKVIRAMLKAHPYEEVAYDLYPLANEGEKYSLGRIGRLDEKVRLDEYIQLVKKRLRLVNLKYVGSESRLIERVAICSGSGAKLISRASKAGADLFITGDIGYHEAQLAEELGMALIDAGHYQTEIIVKGLLTDYLRDKVDGVEFFASQVDTNPWKYI